ncbi:MAG TPA: phosphatase PAP2 family protein [Candidatus Saccharimonadales bacterium]|nr:phosphatase PAP2 family protein [Candidatus Saccharimonadales bacterium]
MEKQEKKHSEKYPRAYVIGLVLALILLVPSLIAGHAHNFSGFQLNLFHDINNWSDSFKTAALWLTEGLGAGYPIVLCVVLPALFKYWRLSWRFFVTVGGAGVLTEIAKFLTKEPRPVVMLHGNLHQRAIETGLNSYPSAHEAVATAMALTLWMILPRRWRWLSIVWILLVALSRIYVGVHTPNDVLGGFLLGLISVCVVRLLPGSLAKPLRLETSRILEKKS